RQFFLHVFQALIDRVVRAADDVRVRNGARQAGVEGGWVHHRAVVVDVVGQNFQILADAAVVVPPRRIAEGINAEIATRLVHGGVRSAQEFLQGRDTTLFGEWSGVLDI